MLDLLDPQSDLRVQADEEALPFAESSFDLVVAPLTLQSINDLPGTLLQIRCCLKPDGLFLGAMFGGATLHELRQVWLEAEAQVYGGASPRVAPFADVRDLGVCCSAQDLLSPSSTPTAFVSATPLRSPSCSNCARWEPATCCSTAGAVPVGRRLLQLVEDIYAERFMDPDGRIRATFEMLVMTAWAPHESQQKPLQPGSASVRLADALGVTELRVHDRDS